METINIAMLQILPEDSIEKNLKKGVDFCHSVKKKDIDLIVFPEMWSNGYNVWQDINKLNKEAISVDSLFINIFKNLAKELEIAICITFLESYTPSPRNSLIIFDRFGKLILHYAKVHTCDFGDEKLLTPGDDFYVATLNTKKGDVKVGAMICYDREFPESARILMLKGAEIIVVPNACPMEINRISQLRGRAYENMLGIVTVNYPIGKPDCNGHSTAFDGIAYKENISGSRDTLIIEAGEDEGIYFAEMSIGEIRKYRNKEVHGNAYRHPNKYKILTEEKVEYPFIRKDYRK